MDLAPQRRRRLLLVVVVVVVVRVVGVADEPQMHGSFAYVKGSQFSADDPTTSCMPPIGCVEEDTEMGQVPNRAKPVISLEDALQGVRLLASGFWFRNPTYNVVSATPLGELDVHAFLAGKSCAGP